MVSINYYSLLEKSVEERGPLALHDTFNELQMQIACEGQAKAPLFPPRLSALFSFPTCI